MVDFDMDRPLDRARIAAALALEDPDQQVVMLMRPSLTVGVAEFFSDNLERAGTLFADVRQHMLDRGEESSLPHLEVDMAMLERSKGNLGPALELADDSYEIARTIASKNAAAGLTNKRIAETLFISAKTVEANLARRYRKLGIRSRAELGRVMAERQQADASTGAGLTRG